MQKLKEMIKRERLLKEDETDKRENSTFESAYQQARDEWQTHVMQNSELKNQIIEILQGSGRCLYENSQHHTYCNYYTDPNSDHVWCSWCQGQEKINKLLEG